MLTYEEAIKLFDYNEHTGIITWKVRPANCVHIGDEAGTYDTGRYLRIYVRGKTIAAHRLAWLISTGNWPKEQIDHINGIRDDNRLINLRTVTPCENSMNQAIPKNNTSGVMGVSLFKVNGKYAAYIRENNKKRHLGYFSSIEEAAAERQKELKKLGFHENHGRKSCR